MTKQNTEKGYSYFSNERKISLVDWLSSVRVDCINALNYTHKICSFTQWTAGKHHVNDLKCKWSGDSYRNVFHCMSYGKGVKVGAEQWNQQERELSEGERGKIDRRNVRTVYHIPFLTVPFQLFRTYLKIIFELMQHGGCICWKMIFVLSFEQDLSATRIYFFPQKMNCWHIL